VSKAQNTERLATILESLSDVTVTLVTDFLGARGGVPIAIGLAALGVNVFPVGVVGEDPGGQQIFDALHPYRISTSGISRMKKYGSPATEDAATEQIHGEHPALLNLIENARKFASASEAMYVCDYGVGAASPRVLNFIKSDGCMRDKTLAARSPDRLPDFEQLTSAIASELEIERAIGVEIGDDAKKLAVAGQGIVQEMKLDSFLAVSGKKMMAFSGERTPSNIALSLPASAAEIDVIGAIFSAAVSTGAEVVDAAQLAVQAGGFLATRPLAGKRIQREELLNFATDAKRAVRVR
jgi:bifunctional ADP-heptose synthase (sugar kinase/adenylyltransferase)